VFAHRDPVPQHRAETDRRAASDPAVAARHDARREAREILHDTVVIERRIRVDDAGCADRAAWIDHGTRHHDRARADRRCLADSRGRMNGRYVQQVRHDRRDRRGHLLARMVVADGDEHARDPMRVDQLRQVALGAEHRIAERLLAARSERIDQAGNPVTAGLLDDVDHDFGVPRRTHDHDVVHACLD